MNAFNSDTYPNPMNLTLDGLVFMKQSVTRAWHLYFTGTHRPKD